MSDQKIEEWSDAKCIEIAYRNNFPSIVKDVNIQKSITNNFLNFYLSGKVPKGQHLMDILFSAISIMPFCINGVIIDNFIWEESHYSEDGTLFFVKPEDRLRHDIKMVLEKNTNPDVSKIDDFKQENENSQEIKGNKNVDLEQGNKSSSVNSDGRDLQNNEVNDDETKISNNDNDNKTKINNDEKQETFRIFESEVEKKPIKWFRLKRDWGIRLSEEKEYGPVENTKFCIYCNKILDNWENGEFQCQLKFFFGVTALVLMRTRVKSINNLDKYFKSKFILLDINRDSIPYSPPHKLCINKSWKLFRNETPDMHTMFAKLVVNSFYINKFTLSIQHQSYNIFRASVLAHTVNTGMGLIALLQRIALYCDIYDVLECLQCEETRDSLASVKQFFEKYMTNNTENTHHWAHLIDPKQFQELSCKNNYKFAVILATFIEKLTKSQEVWNAGWTKNKAYDLDSLKKLGYSMYDIYNTKQCECTLQLLFKDLDINKLIN